MKTEGAAFYQSYFSYRGNCALEEHNCPFFTKKARIKPIIDVNVGNMACLHNVNIVKMFLTFASKIC